MNTLDRIFWGPRFWKILHTLAECSSGLASPILRNDEADIWKILLKTQAFVMPCPRCKEHYLQYRLQKPVPDLRKLANPERKSFLTHWLWECHSNANTETQKESPPEEELSLIYASRDIRSEIADIVSMFSTALERSQLQREDTKRWKMCVARLQMLYGL